jgi:hypothetical protein
MVRERLVQPVRSAATVDVVAPEQPDRRQRRVVALHWASLVGAFAFLLWANRDQWFDTDEWNFLVRRRLIGSDAFLGIWDPHNKHWVTLPVLAYRLLFTLFGVRTYWPYVLLLVLLHLAVAHLLWRLLLTLHVDGVLATAAAGIFAIAGAGWQNVTNAFQISFVGSLLFGLAAVLVARRRELTRARLAAVWLLLVASLMCSGVGITMVAVVTALVLLRHGLRDAVVALSVPLLAYALYFVLQGRHAPPGAGEQALWPALQATPAFLWRGLTDAVDAEIGLAGAGAVVLVLVAVWIVRHADFADRSWGDATVLALGAVLFLVLTAIGRSGLGPEAAGASRYAYITIALLLPISTLALDRLLPRTSARDVVLVGGVCFLVLVSVSLVARNADADGIRKQEQKHRVLAASELIGRHEKFVSGVPVPAYMPDLDVEALRRLRADGKLPGDGDVTAEDVLTARTYLQLDIAEPVPGVVHGPIGVATLVGTKGATATQDPKRSDCIDVTPTSDTPAISLRFDRAGTATMRSQHSGSVVARLEDPAHSATGRERAFPIIGDELQQIALSHGGLVLHLGVPALGTTSLCGLAPTAA